MSRKSPSGPVAITDQVQGIGLSNDITQLPNAEFFVAPLFFAILNGSSYVPVNDVSTPALIVINGPEATPGRIGQARLYTVLPPGSTGDDVKFQFTVDGKPVGNEVLVPWVTSPVPATNDEAFALNVGKLVDFGDVEWEGGQTLILKATFGNITGTGQAIIGVIYDKNFK